MWKWIWRDFNIVSLPQVDIKQLLWIWLFWLCCGNSISTWDLYRDCHLISFDSKLWSFKTNTLHLVLSKIHLSTKDVQTLTLKVYIQLVFLLNAQVHIFSPSQPYIKMSGQGLAKFDVSRLCTCFCWPVFFEFYTWKGYNFKSMVAPLFCFLINGIVFVLSQF